MKINVNRKSRRVEVHRWPWKEFETSSSFKKNIHTRKKSTDVDVYIYLTYMREIIWDLKKIKNKRILWEWWWHTNNKIYTYDFNYEKCVYQSLWKVWKKTHGQKKKTTCVSVWGLSVGLLVLILLSYATWGKTWGMRNSGFCTPTTKGDKKCVVTFTNIMKTVMDKIYGCGVQENDAQPSVPSSFEPS